MKYISEGGLTSQAEKNEKRQILQARDALAALIRDNKYDSIDLKQEMNQHLLRIVLKKH